MKCHKGSPKQRYSTGKTYIVFESTKYLTWMFLIKIKPFTFVNYIYPNSFEKQNDIFIKTLSSCDRVIKFFSLGENIV